MKTRAKNTWPSIAAVVLLACCIPGPVCAAVLAEADLAHWSSAVKMDGGVLVENHGKHGWQTAAVDPSEKSQGYLYLDLKELAADYSQGTLDFVIERHEEAPVEAIFTLQDEQQRPLFVYQIYWDGFFHKSGPEIVIYNVTEFQTWRAYKDNHAGGGLWVPGFRIPSSVNKGKKIRLTVTWGHAPDDNALYVDGARLKTRLPKNFDFASLMKKSNRLVIGTEYDGNYPIKYYSQLRSVLYDFRLLDHPTIQRETSLIPAIAAVTHDAGTAAGISGKLVAGGKLGVKLEGAPGATGTFDIARLPNNRGNIPLNWKGYGVYLDDRKTSFLPTEVNLSDVRKYLVYVSKEPFDAITDTMTPLETLRVTDQNYNIKNLEDGVPYYVAVAALMADRSIKPIIMPKVAYPMAEAAGGIYEGSATIDYPDDYPLAVVVGHLTNEAGTRTLADADQIKIDTSLQINVATLPNELPANEQAISKVTVTVTDANGDPVARHKVRFLLATTSEYTGVVGGGQFKDQVGGVMPTEFWGETDLFGKVNAEYQAGFAAKTAIVVVRDMVSNDTGAGYVKTYIQASADLELQPTEQVAAAVAGYALTLTSSDEWLTADGKSTARLTATLTRNGQGVENQTVSFAVSSGNGSIRVTDGTTDRKGKAFAVYTAGKKIGTVLITASAAGVTASVRIVLRSDAPAKIVIQLDPDKLPADGHSRAEVLVKVTDINDNPNKNVTVEYDIVSGGGQLRNTDSLTDRRGEAKAVYIAGRTPGKVSIGVVVRSAVPTDEEFLLARNLALEVPDSRFY